MSCGQCHAGGTPGEQGKGEGGLSEVPAGAALVRDKNPGLDPSLDPHYYNCGSHWTSSLSSLVRETGEILVIL